MTKLNLGLLLLALPSLLLQSVSVHGMGITDLDLEADVTSESPTLRGSEFAQYQRDLEEHGFNEQMGVCRGAACGLWGDPHMITCDGLGYDCQGIGIFTLMKNHMWNVQGQFVDVGAHEHNLVKGWGYTRGASLSNTIIANFTIAEDAPVMQFGFGNLPEHDGTFPAEANCNEYYYYWPIDMPGQGRSVENTLQDCRKRCEDTEGCTKFHFWADGGCHINNDDQNGRHAPHHWTRSVAGTLESGCGKPIEVDEYLIDEEEKRKHGMIRNQCPLLYYEDGVMQDTSNLQHNGFMLGDHYSDYSVQMINRYAIRIKMKVPGTDQYSEIHLIAKGEGPGQLWSCHWDFYICLPEVDKDLFMEDSIGLMGTPDGDIYNDFMNSEGETVNIWAQYETDWHHTLIDYCYDNWCVSQEDSMMMTPHDQNYGDVACHHEEFVDYEEDQDACVMNADQIEQHCADKPPLMVHACQVDCCNGGCADVPDTEDEIRDVTEFGDDDEVLYDVRGPPEACEDEKLSGTSGDVCTDTQVVKLIGSSGAASLPDKDVFYEIELDSGGDMVGETVKFKVANPFRDVADVYIKYEKSVFSAAFMDPKCEPQLDTPSDCNPDAPIIEAACHHYDGVTPFALVQVYVASRQIESDGSTSVDKCCEAPDYDDEGVVMYTFEVLCTCPGSSGAAKED